MPESPYKRASEILGWRWSPAHDGLINESSMRPGVGREREGGYLVAFDVEDACFLSGIEDAGAAEALVRSHDC